MSKNFELDVRNPGGLKQLSDNMYNHHKALINAKPAINNKPPKSVFKIFFCLKFSFLLSKLVR